MRATAFTHHAEGMVEDDLAPPVTGSNGNPGSVLPPARGVRVSGKGGRGDVLEDSDVADTLDKVGSHPSLNQGVTIVGVSSRGREGGATLEESGEVSSALRGSTGGGSRAMAFAKKHGAASPEDDETWVEADVARSVNAADAHRQDSGSALVLDTYNQSEVEGDVTNTLARSPETALMGAPAESLDEGATCAWDPGPDGRRYEACGDGVASPVPHWIGLRLRAAHEGRDPDA